MSNSLRNDFHSDIAQIVLNDIQYKRANYYYFLGKIDAWGDSDIASTVADDDSIASDNTIRNNTLFIKRISPSDVSLVTNRYDWITDTVFAVWDNTKNMSNTNFYCVTNDFNVYKCLDNSNNAPSTVKPTGKSISVIRTSDGYLWKYMYTIPTFKRTRFMSVANIPVQRALTDSFYNRGSIDSVVVSNSGSGYTDATLTTVAVAGSTTGSGAVGTIVCDSIGAITGVTITNGGTGYTSGVSVSFATINGVGAVGQAVIVGGVVTGITIVSGGTGYVTGSNIVFTVGGAVILPLVSRITGSIVALRILNAGAGYVGTPTLTVSGAGGTGKYGNGTALLSCVAYNGSIVIANIIDPGLSYPVDNATTIVVQGDGSDAVFSPVIYEGQLVDVVVENVGQGYTSIVLTVAGAGSDAKLTPIITSSDFISDQSIIEQTTEIGSIFSVAIVNGGDNYSSSTTVSIEGDGTGCVATPIIVNGVIQKIVVISFGSNYTYANVNISDPNRSEIGDAVDAVTYAIISPNNGHGFDAPNELFGSTLAINTSLRQEESINRLSQDYRQFGILKNPTHIVTGKFITSDSSLIVYETEFADVTGLILDEVLIKDNIKFRVAMIDGTTVFLQQLGVKYINPVGGIVADTESSRTYNILSLISYPSVNKYSGKLLYTANENPFSFSPEQGIVIKTFLKF